MSRGCVVNSAVMLSMLDWVCILNVGVRLALVAIQVNSELN